VPRNGEQAFGTEGPGVTPGDTSPVPRGPTPAQRLSALFEVVACSDFPTQILVGQILMMAGMQPLGPNGQYSASFVFTLSLADAILLIGLIFWFLLVHGESPRQVLFGTGRLRREALFGLVLVPLVLVFASGVLFLVHRLAPSLHNVANNPLQALVRSPADAFAFGIVVVVSGGLREEIQRGFILHRFEQYLGGAPLGLVLSSLAFGAGHVIQGLDAAVAITMIGAFWGVVYLRRRSIIAPIVSHAGFDLLEVIFSAASRTVG
jgi:membrane protease YdiL (CAAX protease family)